MVSCYVIVKFLVLVSTVRLEVVKLGILFIILRKMQVFRLFFVGVYNYKCANTIIICLYLSRSILFKLCCV